MQNPPSQRLGPAEAGLGFGDADRQLADLTLEKPRQSHQGDDRQGAGGISRKGKEPVPEEIAQADLAVDPGHDDQRVAGEEFGTGHDHQHQPQREDKTAQQPGRTIAHVRSGHDGGKGRRAQGNEAARKNRERHERYGRKPRLGDARLLDAARHFGRAIGAQSGRVELRSFVSHVILLRDGERSCP